MRRIKFGIYSDTAKERDDYRLKRCSEAIKKARKAAEVLILHSGVRIITDGV